MVSTIRVATCWSIMFSVKTMHSFNNTVGVELTKSSKATNLATFFQKHYASSPVLQYNYSLSVNFTVNYVILYCKCSFTAERSEAIKSLTDPVPNCAESPHNPPLRQHIDKSSAKTVRL